MPTAISRCSLLLLGVCFSSVVLMALLGSVLPRGTGELAFAAGLDDDLDIYRMDVDRRLTRPIIFNDANDFQPAWSPDGQQIAFVSDRSGKYDLYVMSAEGQAIRRLTDDPVRVFNPAWSPDGKQIAYVTERFGYTEIMLQEVTTGRETRLTSNDSADSSPAWSPDGERIAFVSDRDKRWDNNLYVMKADGSDAQLLEATPGDELAPAWSPDGRYLSYTSDFSNKAILLADLDSGTVAPLFTNNFVGYDTPAWSPDGRYITYSADNSYEGFNLIYVMDTACVPQPQSCPAFIRRLHTGSGAAMYFNPRWKPG
jgi:Tol biopolymer transport system component